MNIQSTYTIFEMANILFIIIYSNLQ